MHLVDLGTGLIEGATRKLSLEDPS